MGGPISQLRCFGSLCPSPCRLSGWDANSDWSHLGHTGKHPPCCHAWPCAPFLGTCWGAVGGFQRAEDWAEIRIDKQQNALPTATLTPEQATPRPLRLPKASLVHGSTPEECGPGSWLSCP